jgi:hypothetical protein
MSWIKSKTKMVFILSSVALITVGVVILSLIFAPRATAQSARPTTPVSIKYGFRAPNSQGKITLAVQLKGNPLAISPDRGTAIKAEQDAVLQKLATYGATEVARLKNVINAVIVNVDSSHLEQIAADTAFKTVSLVENAEITDPATNGLIGATAAQQQGGLYGEGRVVAVLDSGTDYTHKNLGGPGTVEAYDQCYEQKDVAPTGDCAALFGPSAPKVIGGYDFVGETWPNAALAPDSNPIDFGTHGTHVSDIIAGIDGVAPKAKVVAVKVCSAVATSCSGVAILEALDYVAQWNLDPANKNRKIDVVNMSLGGAYGIKQEADIASVEALTQLGVLTVAAAGNDSNKPYVVSAPSIAPSALSVAQTEVPSSTLKPIRFTNSSGTTLLKYSVQQNFGPTLTTTISGPVQYGASNGTNRNACAAFTSGEFTGKIAFVDRGTCAASIKVSNAAAAGALAVIIGFVNDDEPFTFAFGGGNPTVPSFAISRVLANTIRNSTGAMSAVIDPADAINLVGSVVGSSARGPSVSYQSIKPEIGAPGASVSAVAGTGSETEAFGGTSGATPMVAGSALLVKQKYPNFTPLQVKALLMNTANTTSKSLDLLGNFYNTPITRIGSGEVRVNRAVTTQTTVSVVNESSAALSFDYATVDNNPVIQKKTIRITNLSKQGRSYTINATYRDPAANNGAVVFQSGFPRTEWVNANSTRDIEIQVMITGTKLNAWTLNAGSSGNNAHSLTGSTFDSFEYDGYVTVSGGNDQNLVSLPWHVLPHRAANTKIESVSSQKVSGVTTKTIRFGNSTGAIAGKVETFQFLATRASSGPQPGVGTDEALVDLKTFGVREVDGTLQFLVSTYETHTTPNVPAEYDIYIDTTGGSNPNFALINMECGYYSGGNFATDGRNCTILVDLTTGDSGVVGFTDATYNSTAAILSVSLSDLGVTTGQKLSTYVGGADLAFTGNYTSYLPEDGFSTYTVGQPQFGLKALPWQPFASGDNATTFTVTNNGFEVATTSGNSSLSSASGLLFLYRDAKDVAREVQTVTLP